MRLKCSDALKPIYSDLSFKKLFYEQTIKNFECQIDSRPKCADQAYSFRSSIYETKRTFFCRISQSRLKCSDAPWVVYFNLMKRTKTVFINLKNEAKLF